MNRKASENLFDNTIYLILLIAFFAMIILFILSQMNGASFWTNYYAKETTKIINTASPGDKISLDVHKATTVARKNEIEFDQIFSFDNENNEVCVRLSQGRSSCYTYFNDLEITDPKVNLASGSSAKTNILTFKITEIENESNE